MEYLHVQKQEALLPRAWRSMFLRPGLVIKHESWSEPHLCLGAQNTIALFWPLIRFPNGKQITFGLRPIDDASELKFATLLDFKDWEVWPAKCVSPLHLYIKAGRKMLPSLKNAFLLQDGKPRSILVHAAQHAFWGASAQMLKRIMQHEQGQAVKIDSYAELLFTTIQSVLKCKDSEVATIMEACFVSTVSTEEEELMATAVDENVLEETLHSRQSRRPSPLFCGSGKW